MCFADLVSERASGPVSGGDAADAPPGDSMQLRSVRSPLMPPGAAPPREAAAASGAGALGAAGGAAAGRAPLPPPRWSWSRVGGGLGLAPSPRSALLSATSDGAACGSAWPAPSPSSTASDPDPGSDGPASPPAAAAELASARGGAGAADGAGADGPPAGPGPGPRPSGGAWLHSTSYVSTLPSECAMTETGPAKSGWRRRKRACCRFMPSASEPSMAAQCAGVRYSSTCARAAHRCRARRGAGDPAALLDSCPAQPALLYKLDLNRASLPSCAPDKRKKREHEERNINQSAKLGMQHGPAPRTSTAVACIMERRLRTPGGMSASATPSTSSVRCLRHCTGSASARPPAWPSLAAAAASAPRTFAASSPMLLRARRPSASSAEAAASPALADAVRRNGTDWEEKEAGMVKPASPRPMLRLHEDINTPARQVLADAVHDEHQAVDGRPRRGLVGRLGAPVDGGIGLPRRRRRVAAPQPRAQRARRGPP